MYMASEAFLAKITQPTMVDPIQEMKENMVKMKVITP
jgi:hypothetical protein